MQGLPLSLESPIAMGSKKNKAAAVARPASHIWWCEAEKVMDSCKYAAYYLAAAKFRACCRLNGGDMLSYFENHVCVR